MITVTFPSTGVRFSWRIFNDAQTLPDFAAAGSADNTYVDFWMYKDRMPNTLYEVDGWKCTSVYWGF
jgi:hypothetical protein